VKQGESINDRHALVLNRLVKIAWLWKCDVVDIALSTHGESAACDLTSFMRDGVSGALSYSARFNYEMQDKAMFDDILTLQLEVSKLNYEDFCPKVFSQIITAFDPYRAAIVQDLDLDLDDFEEIVEMSQNLRIDVDGRDSVFRVNPVNFFDQQLCRRAFRLDVQHVIERLRGHVQEATVLIDGVLIVVTNEIVDRRNLKALHDHVANLLEIQGDVPE
jgi:hypothetical protein